MCGQNDSRVPCKDRRQGREEVQANIDAPAGKGDGKIERAKTQSEREVMPAHLKQNKYGVWYLVDGYLCRSLKTKVKREADVRLKQYQQGKFGLIQTPTVQQFYDEWIARKIPPLVRESQAKDYRQAFNAYILPRFRHTVLSDIKTKDLGKFQAELIDKGLAVKTCRNIIDGSFRVMYRDARIEIGGDLEGKDPFIDIQWPRQPKTKPDPFTAEEGDRII